MPTNPTQPKVKMPPPIASKEDFQEFKDACVFARSTERHFQALYASGNETRHVLSQAAPIFFGDLNLILLEAMYLQACRLTDKAKFGRHYNHTTNFFVEYGDFSTAPLKLPKLQKLAAKLNAHREIIDVARNKLIAHLDLETVRAGQNLGVASIEAWQQFWLDLQDFVCVLNEQYFGETFFMNGVAMLTDADSLIQRLRRNAVTF